MRRLGAWARGAVGVLFCQTLATAVLVAGWTQRLVRRRVFARWHARAGEPGGFRAFARAHAPLGELADPPRWIAGPPQAEVAPRAGRAHRWLGGLGANLREGLAVVLHTQVLTLPAGALWLFAWYAGWNNSFHKGYEQAWVGPTMALFGVPLFVAAMLYVPLAQARQASARRWQAFYDFGLVFRIVQRRFAACIRLAVGYSLLSVPVMLLKTLPIAFDRVPPFASLEPDAAAGVLRLYFLAGSVLFLAAFLALRLAAGRIYADAVVALVREGELPAAALAPGERHALSALGLLDVEPAAARGALVRAIRGAGRWAWRTAAVALASAVWLSFVAQIFVSEFLNYHPVVGWLNQPLIQLPWFRYLPPGL